MITPQLGPTTCAAIAQAAKLSVVRNRHNSFTAEMTWPHGAQIAATMPTPSEAIAQLEQALIHECAPALQKVGAL